MIIVADTSALFGACDADQEEHQQALAVMEDETSSISPLVLTELDHLTRRDLGYSAAMKITDALLARTIDESYRLAERNTSICPRRNRSGPNMKGCSSTLPMQWVSRSPTSTKPIASSRWINAISVRSPLIPGLRSFRILPADK